MLESSAYVVVAKSRYSTVFGVAGLRVEEGRLYVDVLCVPDYGASDIVEALTKKVKRLAHAIGAQLILRY